MAKHCESVRRCLGSVPSMLHGLELLASRPRDCEQKSRFLTCLKLVLDRCAQCQDIGRPQTVHLSMNTKIYGALQNLNGNGAVRMMFLQDGALIHHDEYHSEV